jgi:hypothetical protein
LTVRSIPRNVSSVSAWDTPTMSLRRCLPLWRPLRRRLCSGCVLLSYLAAVFGLPIPILNQKADAQAVAVPTPSCCCPTIEQREQRCCCCTSKTDAGPSVAPCCQPHHQATGNSVSPERSDPGSFGERLRWIPGVSALRCQGLHSLWVISATAIPAPVALAYNPCLVPCDWFVCPKTQATRLPNLPLDPPPRVYSA